MGYATSCEDSFVDLGEFLIRLVVAVQDLLVMVSRLSIGLGWWVRTQVLLGNLVKLVLHELVVDSKALSIEVVLRAEEVTSVVDVVTGSAKVWASLDGADGHVQIEALVRKNDVLALVDDNIAVILAFLVLDHSSENHDFLAGDLGSSCVDDSQLEIVRDVVDRLPEASLNVEDLNFLYKLIGKFVADPRFWSKALSTDDEDVLLVELANTEGLTWFRKVGQHDPLLGRNRVKLARAKTLNVRSATLLLLSV